VLVLITWRSPLSGLLRVGLVWKEGLISLEKSKILLARLYGPTSGRVEWTNCPRLATAWGLVRPTTVAEWGIHPLAVSGLFKASEVLIQELEDRIAVPVLSFGDLLPARVTKQVVLEERAELCSEVP
jgi:hypothetical protein